jgi:hypothetical protein
VNQALIDEIVSNVLAQLQPAPARPVAAPVMDEPAPQTATLPEPKSTAIEVTEAVITADLLAGAVRGARSITIGVRSILTPSARDWLNTRKISWNRGGAEVSAALAGPAVGNSSSSSQRSRWQLLLQTVTPNVRALHESLKRQPDGWKLDLVGAPNEAATLAARLISTAEADGVVVLTEYAEIIACRANRNERVRAAVIVDRKQLELTRQHLGVNLVCINPHGRTFIELRNLLRDCATSSPVTPVGWGE